MRVIAATLLIAFVAMPGSAEPLDGIHSPRSFETRQLSEPLRPRAKDPIITIRSSELVARDGSKGRERGILIRQEIAPDATIGLGLIKLKPQKSSLSPDPTIDSSARGWRKAAVRLTIKF